MLIDPEGYARLGERAERHRLKRPIAVLPPGFCVAFYKQRGLIDLTPLGFGGSRAAAQRELPLRYPGKILADESSQRLFVADSGHHRIVVLTSDRGAG